MFIGCALMCDVHFMFFVSSKPCDGLDWSDRNVAGHCTLKAGSECSVSTTQKLLAVLIELNSRM